MKHITFEEFADLPVIRSHRSEKTFEVKRGDHLVSFVKSISGLVGILKINKIDTKGCSKDYIIEKINLTIKDLYWIKNRVREIT